MTTKCRTNNQHVTMHTDMRPGGNGGNTSSTPSIKHTFAHMTLSLTPTVILPRIRGGRDATTTTSMRHGLTHMTHHTTGEQGSPSIGSHGCRYRQAPQLQAINEKHKIQKGMEPFIGQQIWMISK
jgi:hypothetical protein